MLAIGHLHKKKVVHRDLKPANIIIADDGYLRLIDFGLARKVSDEYLSN